MVKHNTDYALAIDCTVDLQLCGLRVTYCQAACPEYRMAVAAGVAPPHNPWRYQGEWSFFVPGLGARQLDCVDPYMQRLTHEELCDYASGVSQSLGHYGELATDHCLGAEFAAQAQAVWRGDEVEIFEVVLHAPGQPGLNVTHLLPPDKIEDLTEQHWRAQAAADEDARADAQETEK